MLVPSRRESDWVFSTESGHLQLLLNSPGISRLILAGDSRPSPQIYRRPLEDDVSFRSMNGLLEVSLKPLFLALSPKSCFELGIPDIPILRYEDNVVSSVVLRTVVGSFVGEMLVEDVEIENEKKCSQREFRRRLRFKRMPNLVQTEVRIVPKVGFGPEFGGIGEVEFSPDVGVLVHAYLAPMVASLRLISSHVEERFCSGFMPRALCLGVGGGALLTFLRTQLGFEVLGVEEDGDVLKVGREFFGLEDCDFLKVVVGDAMEFVEKVAHRESAGSLNGVGDKFDVIMVDLDSCDAENVVCAPPLEFRRKCVLLAARSILSDKGILVLNVVPQTSAFYETMKHDLREVFSELYEIDVGNGENFVLVAMGTPNMSSIRDCENSFITKLKLVISGAFMDSIEKT